MPIFSNSASPLFCPVPTDCRSIHIGLSVPTYPQRKRDQRGHLSGLQKVRWGLQPDKPQQELTSAGSMGNSRDSSVEHVSRTREFLRGAFWGAICWWSRWGTAWGIPWRHVSDAPQGSGLPGPLGSAAVRDQPPSSGLPLVRLSPRLSLVTLRPLLWSHSVLISWFNSQNYFPHFQTPRGHTAIALRTNNKHDWREALCSEKGTPSSVTSTLLPHLSLKEWCRVV